MTKTAQTDAAVTRFLEWHPEPTVAMGRMWWNEMPKDERALFNDFEDFGCAVSVRVVNLQAA